MKLSQILSTAALCSFAVASPLPGNEIAEREASPVSPPGYGVKYILEDDLDKREPQRNTYGKAYTLKMKDDGFKKRDPQNAYGRAYTLKMDDDGIEEREAESED
ncbi:hypothetical protein FDENT_3504 [Fusarium denticulatum]|uniref:Uncharacterized protein n=1 Tax=Fusarium denticulatum TaxID=48507 RepID=A0A8H5XCS5_9HYPO|nr:hypothetical protein FDENT_3504 [Fusarium denticulatum]